MSRRTELIALLVSDAVTFLLAWLLYYLARFQWGWLGEPPPMPGSVALSGFVVGGFWLVLFVFSGMYRERYASSRLDELVSLAKVVSVGLLILFFVLFIDTLDAGAARENILFYWLVLFALVAAGRLAVRSLQKRLILRGHGLHKALIVGWSDRVEQLYEEVARYPAAGLQVVGALRLQREEERAPYRESRFPTPGGDGGSAQTVVAVQRNVHSIEALPALIDRLGVQDVLIALGNDDHGYLMEVLRLCDGKSVSLKLVPDFYTIIGGMARTEHMYGLPLIEVLPEPMPAWEQSTKRLLDLFVSVLVLGGGLVLWTAIGLLVRLTSPGAVLYKQQRVGQHGRPFTLYKFRTMRVDAEADSGPVWARENDPRYTPLGRWLRRTRLDEIPNFWNVLKGEMSLVGPRPERPFFVDRLTGEIPLYTRRQRVKPGITGLAQVKWKYDESLEDVRQKVKYDLFYIENMSLRMDFQILFQTIRTTLLGRGR